MDKLVLHIGDFNFQQLFSEYKGRYGELIEQMRPRYMQEHKQRTKDEVTQALHEVFLTGLILGSQGTRPNDDEVVAFIVPHSQAAADRLNKLRKQPLQPSAFSQLVRGVLPAKYPAIVPVLNEWLLNN